MIKSLPIKNSYSYTIIEVLISIFILILIFSVVQANYRQFILVKSLDTTKSQIISDIKLAQEYALAGKRPSACTGLNGYIFATDLGNNRYTITADCATDVLVKTVELSRISKGISVGSSISVLYKVIAMGTDIPSGTSRSFNIVQQTTGSIRTITILPVGEVK